MKVILIVIIALLFYFYSCLVLMYLFKIAPVKVFFFMIQKIFAFVDLKKVC